MNEMLKTILDMDKAAQKKVEEAEEYRRNAISNLSARKTAIVEDETNKAKESAVRRSDRRKAEGENYLKSVRAHNAEVLRNIERLYEKNADKWVDEIVANVTK